MLSSMMHIMLGEIDEGPRKFHGWVSGFSYNRRENKIEEINFWYPLSSRTFWALFKRGFIDVSRCEEWSFVVTPTPAGRAALEVSNEAE